MYHYACTSHLFIRGILLQANINIIEALNKVQKLRLLRGIMWSGCRNKSLTDANLISVAFIECSV